MQTTARFSDRDREIFIQWTGATHSQVMIEFVGLRVVPNKLIRIDHGEEKDNESEGRHSEKAQG